MAKNRLTHKQNKAIAALMIEATQGRAATAAGVSLSTIRRWLVDPVFKAELARVEAEAIDAASRSIAAGAKAAVDLLNVVVNDESMTPAERVNAADKILRHLPSVRLLGTLEKRIAELENFDGE